MAKKEETNIESERSKKLYTLKSQEDLQKDIQSMYGEGQKIISSVKDVEIIPTLKHTLSAIHHNVSETKVLGTMNVEQVQTFWHNAYSNLESLKAIKENYKK